jgi:hypothetical protein
MTIEALIGRVRMQPEEVEFDEVMAVIDENYLYTPARFRNGSVSNEAGSNEGSCKLFAFAQMHALSKTETLTLFGKYFRDDVMGNPNGKDHANIRNFMLEGWPGIEFEAEPLKQR